jgi:hypothetical protein
MKCNMGRTDRTVRFVLGALILAAGLYYQSWWGLVGLLPLGTSLVGWCAAYVPFKFSTAGPKEE